MNKTLLALYHHAPYPLRVVMASARGYQLRRWRYSPATDQLVTAALERETWSSSQWWAWQQERLDYVLQRAATQVPYYRTYWLGRRRGGDHASWADLDNWPVLTKAALRTHPAAFVADDCQPQQMFHEHTSGTTGRPISFWWSHQTVEQWYSLFEARTRMWHGLSRTARWAMLGGQLVTRFAQNTPPYWVWNAGLNQLYLSAHHLAPQTVAAYLDAMRRHGVRYLFGYASALDTLAHTALQLDCPRPTLEVVISNAEPLFAHQRRTIAACFGCPVQNTYGMAEIVAAGSECSAGTMHLWPEVGIIETMCDSLDRLLPPGQAGRLICTGLLNADMPLIRYQLGDRGTLATTTPCSCGRGLPAIAEIHGRVADVIVTPEGRRVWGESVTIVFDDADLQLQEVQLVQETQQTLRVRYVPLPGFTQREAAQIVAGLRARVGGMQIVLEAVDQLPRTANGKVQSVISLLSTAQRPGEHHAAAQRA